MYHFINNNIESIVKKVPLNKHFVGYLWLCTNFQSVNVSENEDYKKSMRNFGK